MEAAEKGSSAPRPGSGAYDIDSALGAAAARLSAAAHWSADRKADRSEWSTWQVLAHLVAVTEGYTEYANGRRTPIADVTDLPSESLRMIGEVGESDPAALTERLQTAVDVFTVATRSLAGSDLFYWHGLEIPLDCAKGILLGELLIHGLDLARAHDHNWPITAADAIAVLEGMMAVAPSFVTPAAADVTATIRVKLRKGPNWLLRFDQGKLSVDQDLGGPVDWTITADPAAFLLLAYGRDSQLRHLIGGRVAGWGKRPGVGLRFNSFIAKP